MKQLIFIITLAVLSFSTLAQPNINNTFAISDASYNKTANIKITTGNTAIVTIDSNKTTLNIYTENGKVLLQNKADNQAILSQLKISADLIEAKYGQYEGLENLERLLTRANELPQHTLYILNENQIPQEEILVSPEEASGTAPGTSSNNWYWYAILGVAGLAVGFMIGKMSSKNNDTPEEIEVESAPNPVSALQSDDSTVLQPDPPKTTANLNITQLKQKYDKLVEDSKVLKQSYVDLKRNHKELKQSLDFDLVYYKTAFQGIIVPLQQAIDQGDLAHIFKYLTLAAVQYSAITREKLSKKQNYDITNINLLLDKKSDHESYPVLSKDTPADKTPNNLKQTISVLKQLGITDLDNYVIHGYKIKDL